MRNVSLQNLARTKTHESHAHTLPVPLVEPGSDDTNDSLPGQRGCSVFLQDHLPVVAAMGEDGVGTHTHPGGVLPNTDCVASIADVGFRVTLVRVPQETWVYQNQWLTACLIKIGYGILTIACMRSYCWMNCT